MFLCNYTSLYFIIDTISECPFLKVLFSFHYGIFPDNIFHVKYKITDHDSGVSLLSSNQIPPASLKLVSSTTVTKFSQLAPVSYNNNTNISLNQLRIYCCCCKETQYKDSVTKLL